jgi:hypothetical protein
MPGPVLKTEEERALGAPREGERGTSSAFGPLPPKSAPPCPPPATGPTPLWGVIEGRPALTLSLPPLRTLTLPVGRSSASSPGERAVGSGIAPSGAAQGVPPADRTGNKPIPPKPVNTAFLQLMQRTGKAAHAAPTSEPPLPLDANGLVMGLVQILNSWQGEDFFRAPEARFEKGQAHETQSLWRPRQKTGR